VDVGQKSRRFQSVYRDYHFMIEETIYYFHLFNLYIAKDAAALI
jgi:hypothetical protein